MNFLMIAQQGPLVEAVNVLYDLIVTDLLPIFLTLLFAALATLFVSAKTGVTQWVKQNATERQLRVIDFIVERAVQATEQLARNETIRNTAEEKLNTAAVIAEREIRKSGYGHYLDDQGQALVALIESKVNQGVHQFVESFIVENASDQPGNQ